MIAESKSHFLILNGSSTRNLSLFSDILTLGKCSFGGIIMGLPKRSCYVYLSIDS